MLIGTDYRDALPLTDDELTNMCELEMLENVYADEDGFLRIPAFWRERYFELAEQRDEIEGRAFEEATKDGSFGFV